MRSIVRTTMRPVAGTMAMVATMRTVAVAGAVAIVALAGQVAAAAEASPDVKLLHGFELDEIVGNASRDPSGGKDWRFIGKLWEGGDVKSGWRVKDHIDELKLPADYDGPVSVYYDGGSRDGPVIHLYHTGATQGKYSKRATFTSWKYVQGYSAGQAMGLMAQPVPGTSYHGIKDWFYQREGNFFDSALESRHTIHDWTGYERLRVDFYSEGAPAVVAIRVFDGSGPRIGAHILGLRTALAVYNLPKDKQVTCEFPLAEMARAAELDLAKITGFILRVNGYEGEARLYFDNIRLVKKDAAEKDTTYPVIKMEGEAKPFARPVIYNPVKRDAEKMKPVRGKVEKVGPVTVFTGQTGWNAVETAFGGSGGTYFQSMRRGCVAWDDNRLLVAFGTRGVTAAASFDGGKTWGGIMPDEKKPTCLPHWALRGSGSADTSGDVYAIGTENCTSYHEGYGVLFKRLAFVGEGWVDEKLSLISQNLRKCPCESRAWRLPNGRIWTVYTDGWGGCVANFSDDDGYTWAPCKDASKPVPRPFYEPNLEDLKKPVEERPKPPKEILPWAGSPVCGWNLLPLKDQMAVVGDGMQVHDGKAWGPVQKIIPKGYSDSAVLGDKLFLAKGGIYGDVLKAEKRGDLKVTWQEGDGWKQETLEPDNIGDAILTACGDVMVCFYVKVLKEGDEENVNEVRARRFKDGKWGESELVATENFRINRLAAPLIGAPNYAAVWWDERPLKGTPRKQKPAERMVRFARVPNK
ncbi:MAG: hypothetical protein V1809_12515 [Planctomycetota bacterium]